MLIQPISIHSIGAAIVVIEINQDGQYILQMINAAAEILFDMPNRPRLGSAFDDFENMDELQVFQAKRLIRDFERCRLSGKEVVHNSRIKLTNGHWRWLSHLSKPSIDDTGQVEQIIVSSADISELVKLRRALDHEKKLLADANHHSLSGFITICAECKSIKAEKEWQSIEQYISDQMDYRQFNHGICEFCTEKLYGDDLNPPI